MITRKGNDVECVFPPIDSLEERLQREALSRRFEQRQLAFNDVVFAEKLTKDYFIFTCWQNHL